MKKTILLSVVSLVGSLLLCACGGGGGGSAPAPPSTPTYGISGTVSFNGAGLAGVTMTLSGTGSASATTDASGNFSFSGLANGSYTITPAMSKYVFDPVSSGTVTVNGADVTGVLFAASTMIGSWINSGSAVSILTVFADGTFLCSHYDAADAASTGVEYGTYGLTGSTFTPAVVADTNGDWGLSKSGAAGAPVGYSVSGDSLTIASVNLPAAWTRIRASATNSLAGSWLYSSHDGSASYPVVGVMTFIDDTTFLFADYDSYSSTRTGLEYGTYTSSAASFTLTVVTDTNEPGFGLSAFSGAPQAYAISGSVLTFGSYATPMTRIQ